jgi:hypothetical protein
MTGTYHNSRLPKASFRCLNAKLVLSHFRVNHKGIVIKVKISFEIKISVGGKTKEYFFHRVIELEDRIRHEKDQAGLLLEKQRKVGISWYLTIYQL